MPHSPLCFSTPAGILAIFSPPLRTLQGYQMGVRNSNQHNNNFFRTDVRYTFLMTPTHAVSLLLKASCPRATQDVGVNLSNRKKAIEDASYGPLNPSEPNTEYWQELADEWEVPVAEAKKQRCGNCAAFIQTPAMLECIKGGLAEGDTSENAWDVTKAGELGYCEAFDFKCASRRTCRAWIVGGPITKGARNV